MMRVLRVLVAVVCVWAGITLLQAPVAEPQKQVEQQLQFHGAEVGKPIAGIPFEEAMRILERHRAELERLPGVKGVGLATEGIYVYTERPEILPPVIGGLPIKVVPQVSVVPLIETAETHEQHPSPGTPEMPFLPGISQAQARTILDRHREELLRTPGVYEVGLGEGVIFLAIFVHSKTGDLDSQVLQQARAILPVTIEGIPTEIKPLAILPPPPGVVILKVDGTYEQADSCPARFEEVKRFSWRLCLAPDFVGSIPALMEPPTAGIPHEEVLKIYERHKEELIRLPGVTGVGLGAEGINVYTDQPEVIPSEVEGLPVKIHPSLGPLRTLSHTRTQPIDPLHGSVAIIDNKKIHQAPPGERFGTLTGIVVSHGKPWLVFPAHVLDSCDTVPPYQVLSQGGPAALNSCPHYGTKTKTMLQPTSPGMGNETVGFTQRWDQHVDLNVRPGTDVAAAFMDNFTNPTTMTTVDGDGSLRADRTLEGTNFSGRESVPMRSQIVIVVSSRNDPPRASHFYFVQVDSIDARIEPIPSTNCTSNGSTIQLALKQQIIFTPLDDTFVRPGDSGSPILGGGGDIVGMVNWAKTDFSLGGGTNAAGIKATLGFNAWYGTQTVQDRTVGVFRPGSHQWVLDNGNGRIDACGTDLRYNDTCLGPLGSTGEYPVVGNWTGRGVYTVGQYRIGTFIPSINLWLLDTNGNGAFNNDCFAPGGDWCPGLSISQPTDIGVVGDWNGDGRIKIGQFRPSTAQWFLDWNGNGVWDGCTIDRCYTFGMPNDRPVVGDWNGDGRTKIGTFRNGTWKVDGNGNGSFGGGDATTTFGVTGDTPVVGHWSGLTVSQIGIFRFENGKGLWGLDGNNSGTFTNCADDICYVYGVPGDVPVTWRPSTVRAN